MKWPSSPSSSRTHSPHSPQVAALGRSMQESARDVAREAVREAAREGAGDQAAHLAQVMRGSRVLGGWEPRKVAAHLTQVGGREGDCR